MSIPQNDEAYRAFWSIRDVVYALSKTALENDILTPAAVIEAANCGLEDATDAVRDAEDRANAGH